MKAGSVVMATDIHILLRDVMTIQLIFFWQSMLGLGIPYVPF